MSQHSPTESPVSRRRQSLRLTDETNETEDSEGITRRRQASESSDSSDSYGSSDSSASSVRQALARQIEDAVCLSLPTSKKQSVFNTVLPLVRRLKAVAVLEYLNADHEKLREIAFDWHCRSVFCDRPFEEETWMQFQYAWAKVRVKMGESPMATAEAAALTAEPLPCLEQISSARIREWMMICAELQRIFVDQAFPMSCRKAGKLMGINHDAAALIILDMCKRGLLVRKAEHTETKARRYLFPAAIDAHNRERDTQ